MFEPFKTRAQLEHIIRASAFIAETTAASQLLARARRWFTAGD